MLQSIKYQDSNSNKEKDAKNQHYYYTVLLSKWKGMHLRKKPVHFIWLLLINGMIYRLGLMIDCMYECVWFCFLYAALFGIF